MVPFGLVNRNFEIFGTEMALFDLRFEILPSSGSELLPSLSIFTVLEVLSDLPIVALDGPGVV